MESPAGSSGGSAEGASEGRQPLTGPRLPPAAQAAKTKFTKKPRARRATKFLPEGQTFSPALAAPPPALTTQMAAIKASQSKKISI